MTTLGQLAAAVGILPGYHDLRGVFHATPPDTQRALLAAIGLRANTDAEAVETLDAWRRRSRTLAPPVVVWRQGFGSVLLHVPAEIDPAVVRWRFRSETGAMHEGRMELRAVSDRLEGPDRQVKAATLELGESWPAGYHTLTIACGDQEQTCALIIAPPHAYLPQWQRDGQGLWGIASHIYSLRTAGDWGMGDMTALRQLIEATGQNGGDLVAINPLHALFPAAPMHASPYWPSSRLFLNPLYLDFEAIPEIAHSAALQKLSQSSAFQDRRARTTANGLVDYAEVATLKRLAIDVVLPAFEKEPIELQTFIQQGGVPLQRFAVFCALSEQFHGAAWQTWPTGLRHPETPEAKRWAEDHAPEVRTHVVLQWLMTRQLADTSRAASGMKIGLMRDLAVGVSPDGADAWAEQAALAQGTRLGAPPDDFAAGGQDWGIPPFNPIALREQTYKPFIAALRANMNNAGALRIDHVMGLMRQFWIPPGAGASAGAYMQFPFDDLLGIVALESERQRCLVVGEDLGTVPEGFRERMECENIFSMRLFRFERYPDGLFKRPDTYPRKALAQAGTHDLPTIAGFWSGADIESRTPLPDPDREAARVARQRERELIMAALKDQNLVGPDTSDDLAVQFLIAAIHAFLARSRAQIVTVALEDVLGLSEQINVPGTTTEYPNWRRRLPLTVEELMASRQWAETMSVMRELRAK